MLFGVFLSAILLILLSSFAPDQTRLYVKGMIDCRTKPDKCDTIYQIYLTEKRLEVMRKSANQ